VLRRMLADDAGRGVGRRLSGLADLRPWMPCGHPEAATCGPSSGGWRADELWRSGTVSFRMRHPPRITPLPGSDDPGAVKDPDASSSARWAAPQARGRTRGDRLLDDSGEPGAATQTGRRRRLPRWRMSRPARGGWRSIATRQKTARRGRARKLGLPAGPGGEATNGGTGGAGPQDDMVWIWPEARVEPARAGGPASRRCRWMKGRRAGPRGGPGGSWGLHMAT